MNGKVGEICRPPAANFTSIVPSFGNIDYIHVLGTAMGVCRSRNCNGCYIHVLGTAVGVYRPILGMYRPILGMYRPILGMYRPPLLLNSPEVASAMGAWVYGRVYRGAAVLPQYRGAVVHRYRVPRGTAVYCYRATAPPR